MTTAFKWRALCRLRYGALDHSLLSKSEWHYKGITCPAAFIMNERFTNSFTLRVLILIYLLLYVSFFYLTALHTTKVIDYYGGSPFLLCIFLLRAGVEGLAGATGQPRQWKSNAIFRINIRTHLPTSLCSDPLCGPSNFVLIFSNLSRILKPDRMNS